MYWLSRKRGKYPVRTYLWNPAENFIEDEAILNADYIIHLAGANLFDRAWTAKYREEIILSRTRSANLLYGKVKIFEQPVKAFISASGINFYGRDTKNLPVTESSSMGDGFLAEVVQNWENAANQFAKMGIRTVKMRTGIVLGPEQSALQEFIKPVRFWVGAPLGTGKQYVSWIHIEDLANIFLASIDDASISGPVNAVSPKPETNRNFLYTCARTLKKPFFLPKVPSKFLEILFGKEKASVLLGGNLVVPQVLQEKGFAYKYPELASALDDLLLKRKHNILAPATV